MAEHHWLIFLTENASTNGYLKNADTPFNAELFVAKLTEENVEIEEAYRVAKDYPLRISKYGVWENPTRNFISLTDNQFLYLRRDNLEGIPLRASTRNVNEILIIF